MSTLWTPGGEVPIEARRSPEPAQAAVPPSPADSAESPHGSGTPDEAEMQAQMERMTEMLLGTPAADVVAEHAMGLYELAAIHLSQPTPDRTAASLAIDALDALLSGLGGRLGQAEPSLRQVLPQLKMAFVERCGQSDA